MAMSSTIFQGNENFDGLARGSSPEGNERNPAAQAASDTTGSASTTAPSHGNSKPLHK